MLIRRTSLPLLAAILGSVLVAACAASDDTGGGDDLLPDASAQADTGTTKPDANTKPAVDGGVDAAPDAPAGECDGKADGTPCGSATASECDLADTCKAGVCAKNLAATGTSCGNAPTECTEQGTCDGQGKCNGNPKAAGSACGDATVTACTAADTCDGAGTCLPNHATAGTACGDATVTECTAADTCDGAGVCQANHQPDGTACGSTSDTACNEADTCLAGACVTNVAADGAFCQDCAAGAGKCGLCGGGACPNLCEAPTATGIETTFAGGNNHRGNMFEVDVTKDIMILGADINAQAGTAAPIEIYTHAGAIAGTTTNAAAWFLRASANTNSDTGRTPTGPVFVPLTSGTHSVYVTRTVEPGPSLNYTDGTSVGTTVSNDGTLLIKQGYGKAYPFGADFAPRIWNGAFRYVPGTSTTYAGGATDHGAMFDIKATSTQSIRAFSVNLPAGDHNLRIYFHPGTYVGTEATESAWIHLGGDIPVKGAGEGGPTAIPFPVDVTIPAGKTYAFYLTTTGATTLSSTAGTAVGTLASAAGAVEIYEGAGVAYPFGTLTTPRKANVTAYFGNCN
ncbi:MAG TPA: hypothetical protein VM925_22200 [Labilithrix sp.]|nr:hypothetical protein [Labilithrix sp.]